MKFYSEKSFKSSRSALITIMVIFQLGINVPLLIIFLTGPGSDRLTIGSMIYLILLGIFLSAIGGLMFWLTIIEPTRKERDARMASKHDVSTLSDDKES